MPNFKLSPRSLKFLRFGTVGFVGFLINAVLLEVFSSAPILGLFLDGLGHLSVPAWLLGQAAWAAGLSTEIAIVSNFLFNNFWTFGGNKVRIGKTFFLKFLQFNLVSFGAVIIEFGVVGLSTHLFGNTLPVRQISLLGGIIFLIVPYNWLMYNKVIWKSPPEDKTSSPT